MIKTIQNSIAIFFLIIIYFLAGFNKIINFQQNVNGLRSRFLFRNLPSFFSIFGIFSAIIIEILAPIIILFSLFYFSNTLKIFTQTAIYSLIIFTLFASFLYHPPNDPNEKIAFLKNMGLVGGFILMLHVFE
jgi:hypothetical protein